MVEKESGIQGGEDVRVVRMEGEMKQWLLARAKERTTWAGIVAVATAFGLNISPEDGEAIITGAMAIIGIVFAGTKG